MNTEILCKLRPWQIEPAKHLLEILRTHDSALDCSDTGVGKSYVAMAIAKELQLPCLVVAPKIAITSWRAVAEHFNEPISICGYEKLRTGRTLFGGWSRDVKIISRRPALYLCCYCQRRFEQPDLVIPCSANASGIHCVERKARPKLLGHFQWDKSVRLLIWDEIQRCSGMNSLNSKMLIACKKARIKHLMLSATPFDTVLKAKAIGYSLDFFTL